MEYYLPRELVLIGCGKRIDSVQPEKNSSTYIQEEGEEVSGRVLTPIEEHGNERNGTRLFVVIRSVPT